MKRSIRFKGLRTDVKGRVYSESILQEKVSNEKENAHGEWVKVDERDTLSLFCDSNNKWIEVIPETVCQFTGLKDSKRTKEFPNGQDIYEGDNLNITDYDNGTWKTTVRFSEGGFLIDVENCDHDTTCIGFLDDEATIEVTSNIHDKTQSK